jgi:methyl-accepting chemotaxis protein
MENPVPSGVKTDLIWKLCAAGLAPALLWINTISNDVAVLKARLDNTQNAVDSAAEDIKALSKTTTANAVTLGSITVTLDRIDKRMEETRTDIRALNTRLFTGSQ